MARRGLVCTACLVWFLTCETTHPSVVAGVGRFDRVGSFETGGTSSLGRPAEQHDPNYSPELRRQALELAYNLDHEQAISLLRKAVVAAPSDPATHRTLASVLWLHMLYLRGAVTVDHYLGSFSRARVDLKKPPADLDAEFRKHVRIAIDLAQARVRKSPKDPQARYDLGAALGLDASYIATVEGRMLAGFKAARRCFQEHERVLELDRSRHDAELVVGMYRYIISTLSLPMRVVAYVAGFGGGKETGVAMLQRAAAGSGEARTDALFALVLVYNRERRFDEALAVLQQLRALYPRNRLVLLEAGATASRAGRPADADRLITEGMRLLLGGIGQAPFPGEQALWRYKRGAARAALQRPDAAEDLRLATTGDAQAWVAGRARLELAKLAQRQGDAAAARHEAKEAESLCQNGNDPQCVEEARKVSRSTNGR
jgi:tetratricopeptide (TPR) repeat protein